MISIRRGLSFDGIGSFDVFLVPVNFNFFLKITCKLSYNADDTIGAY